MPTFRMRAPAPPPKGTMLLPQVIWECIFVMIAPPIDVEGDCSKTLMRILKTCRGLFHLGLEHLVTRHLLHKVDRWHTLPVDSSDRMKFLWKLANKYMEQSSTLLRSVSVLMVQVPINSDDPSTHARVLLNHMAVFGFMNKKDGRVKLLHMLTHIDKKKMRQELPWLKTGLDKRVDFVNTCIQVIKILIQESFTLDATHAAISNTV